MNIFQVGTIKRLPLGTDYNNAVQVVLGLARRCAPGTEIVIDGTGIGKAIADMFKHQGVVPWCVTATAGVAQTIDHGQRTANVPKIMLISRMQSLLFGGQLKVNADLAEAQAFLEELRDFRVEYSASGQMSYAAKSGKHDDIIASCAVAVWRLSDGTGGWGPPSEYLAAVACGRAPTGAKTSPWAIGVDLGKTGDPTAATVVRRVEVEGPVEHVDASALQVMEAVPPIELPTEPRGNETAERLRRQAMATNPTPAHPDMKPDPEKSTWLNGPRASSYAIGSLEWEQQQKGSW